MSKKIFEYREDINGKTTALFSWSQDFNFVACAGDKQIIYILDKRGKKLKDIGLSVSNKVIQLEWDKDHETICILLDGVNYVLLWQVFNSNSLVQLEMDNTKYKATWIRWSKTHPVLAIGQDKGGILFYYKKNQKKVPTMGKHSKRVISGDWNKEGLLITGGEDKIITVSNYNSETVFESITVKGEIRNIQWSRPKRDERESQQNCVTFIVQNKSILMFELGKNHKTPFELQFENRYGKIVDYSPLGDGYMVVGFSEGWVAHISTHMKEIIEDEIKSEKVFNGSLEALCTNDELYKLAVAGESSIKIYNLSTWKEIQNERIVLPAGVGRVSRLSFSNNGQILIATTSNGYLIGFLTSVPTLTAVCNSLLALQASFTEFMITETSKQQLINITNLQLETEPTQIALSQQHFASGVNNVIYYYQWLDLSGNKVIKGGKLLQKKDYMGYVQQMYVNDHYAAVLSDGRCTLHLVDPTKPEAAQREKTFPSSEGEKTNLQIGLTKFFLILLDEAGKIRLFHLQDQTFVVEYNNDLNIQRIFPNFSGTRIVAINNKNQGFLFESATENMFRIAGFPEKAEKVIWDQKDPNLFATTEQETMLTFLINKNNLNGESIAPVPELLSIEALQKSANPVSTILDKGLKPLQIVNGFLKCYTAAGSVQSQFLASHSFLNSYKGIEDTQEGHFRYYLQNMALLRYANALIAAINMKNVKLIDILGRKCLENMELDVAVKAFQSAQNVSMVMMINSFKDEREKGLLFANVAMILGQYDLAQDLFLKSSQPQNALDLRCDIQDYVSALTLAKSIAPQQEPYICRRLAIQIETQGNNPEALKLYERAVLKDQNILNRKDLESHNSQCFAGIARTSIKMGDILRGQNITRTIKDQQTVHDIAQVCENMKQYVEAAEMYEQAGFLEKAATLYIQQKMFKYAAPLMDKLTSSPNLQSLYAKSKESEGKYKEAEQAYEKAGDWENVIRLNVNQLDDIEKAKFVLRNKCSQNANMAAVIASYCDKRGSKAEAIEFLILAGKKEEAFTIAQTHGEMDVYAEHLKNFTLEDRLKVATYYEGKSQWEKAAFHYDKANNPLKALKLYEEAGEDYIQDMVDLVARNKTDNLIQSLLDYLMGEKDNYPKDPYWTYKLYRQLENFKAAARIAITIAAQEQEQGNYKQAHQRLFETCEDFNQGGIQQPYDLQIKLLILHSYIIVKRIIKAENHEDAAKLLDRVCKNISQFPSHAVNILTSAVIESIRANLKVLAYQWSVVLMRPEYRPQINEKFKNKIENIARKPIKDEIDEVKTPCPFCQENISEYANDCTKCQSFIPFCIASGKHIIHQQTCLCPHCKFPAIITNFKKMLAIENTCPMCGKEVNPNDLVEVGEEELKKLKKSGETQQQSQQQQQQQQ